jgi:hypothetical protein
MHATSQIAAQEDAPSRETANNTENALFHRITSIVPRFELGRTELFHWCKPTSFSPRLEQARGRREFNPGDLTFGVTEHPLAGRVSHCGKPDTPLIRVARRLPRP